MVQRFVPRRNEQGFYVGVVRVFSCVLVCKTCVCIRLVMCFFLAVLGQKNDRLKRQVGVCGKGLPSPNRTQKRPGRF